MTYPKPGMFDKLADSVTALAAETKMSTIEVKALNMRREKLSKLAVALIVVLLMCTFLLIGLTVANALDRRSASERAGQERARQAELFQRGVSENNRIIIIANRCEVSAKGDTVKYEACIKSNNIVYPPVSK